MKKLLVILSVLFLTMSVVAQTSSSPVSIYAGGAFSMPSGGSFFTDAFKTGFHGSIGLGWKVAPTLQMVPKVEFHQFSSEASGVLGISDGSKKIWMFGLDGRFSPSVPAFPLKPYFVGGGGFANVKQSQFSGPTLLTSVLNTTVPADQTKFYFNVGAGLDLFSNPAFSLWLQARYVSVSTDTESTQFVPVSLGVKFL